MCLKTSQAKSCELVKKVAKAVTARSRGNHYRRLWKCLVGTTSVSGRYSPFVRRPRSVLQTFLFPSLRPRAILWPSSASNLLEGPDHGMDDPATRRDRPELRSQLVRQR